MIIKLISGERAKWCCWEKLPGTLDTDGGPFGRRDTERGEVVVPGLVNQFGGFISRAHLLFFAAWIHIIIGIICFYNFFYIPPLITTVFYGTTAAQGTNTKTGPTCG